ncbi:hypothetical protein DFH09DRAFT_1378420 [Mycena vulgaris]|nr:hypothetical protein DFH09DRAFT_1378420 [Mycena vulgaris]
MRHRPTFDVPFLPLFYLSTSREPQGTYGWTLTQVLFGFLEVPRLRLAPASIAAMTSPPPPPTVPAFKFWIWASRERCRRAAIFLLWILYSREQVRAPSRHQRARHSTSGFYVPASGVMYVCSRAILPFRLRSPSTPGILILDLGFPRHRRAVRRYCMLCVCAINARPRYSNFGFQVPASAIIAPPLRRYFTLGFRVPASEVTRFALPPAAIAPSHRQCVINAPPNI